MDLNKFTEQATAALASGAGAGHPAGQSGGRGRSSPLRAGSRRRTGSFRACWNGSTCLARPGAEPHPGGTRPHPQGHRRGGAHGQAGITQRLNQLLLHAQDEAKKLKGRVRLGRAPHARDVRREARHRRGEDPARSRPDPRRLPRRHAGSARQPARHQPESRGDLRGAAEIRSRPHRAGAAQNKLDPVIGRDTEIRRTIQVLSRRTKNNPGPHRRTGRGQDGNRRGAGAAHRGAGRAGKSAREEDHLARPGRAHRRGEIPRRVRGAAQGRAGRGRQVGGAAHPLHRRDPHHGRRGQGRGLDGRGQHA